MWKHRMGLAWLCFGGWLLLGCEPNVRFGSMSNLPSGWEVQKGRSQMLARSYPKDDWLTLIVTPPKRPGLLMRAGLPLIPKEKGSGQMPLTLQGLLRQKAMDSMRSNKRVEGIVFWFRSSRAIVLEGRLRAQTSLHKHRMYRLSFSLPESPRRWVKRVLRFSAFRAHKSVAESLVLRMLLVRHGMEFWSSTKTKQGSATVTVRGPAWLLASKTTPRKPRPEGRSADKKGKSRVKGAASSPIHRITSRPVLRRPVLRRPVLRGEKWSDSAASRPVLRRAKSAGK